MAVLRSLTCTGAAQATSARAQAVICFVCGALARASSWIARAGVAARASLRCAVDLVGSAQVCKRERQE
jgi:hypothetical protein